jgi:hypothetical protein
MSDTQEQLDDIGVWKAQIQDMATEIAARYPDWALARALHSHLELVVCELVRLGSSVRITDREFIETAVAEYRRERARQVLREREEQERAVQARLESSRIRLASEQAKARARSMRRSWYQDRKDGGEVWHEL